MQPSQKDEHRRAETTLKAGQDAAAVVHILSLPADSERLAALASTLEARGLIPWPDHSFANPGPIPTSAKVLTETLSASRAAIGNAHPGLPVVLVGLGYGALLLPALLDRLPTHYRAACSCDMPALSRMKRGLLLTLLVRERFRLGSDVPSPIMRRAEGIEIPVGLAIALLRLAGKHRADTARVPATTPFFRCHLKSISDSRSVTYGQNRNLANSNLNQDLNTAIADEIESLLAVAER